MTEVDDMDILFSCYRAAFSPNDQYLIADALNTDDQRGVKPCSPVHAMAPVSYTNLTLPTKA